MKPQIGHCCQALAKAARLQQIIVLQLESQIGDFMSDDRLGSISETSTQRREITRCQLLVKLCLFQLTAGAVDTSIVDRVAPTFLHSVTVLPD